MSAGLFHIEIKGKKETLRFNNYSTEELKSYLFPDKAIVTQTELNEVVAQKWKENGALLIKSLVYAGLCGHYYVVSDHNPYTKEEIGEFVADAKPEEILPIFNAFFKASGAEIIDDEDPSDGDPVKKKTEESS